MGSELGEASPGVLCWMDACMSEREGQSQIFFRSKCKQTDLIEADVAREHHI